jgi:hypothetical protein
VAKIEIISGGSSMSILSAICSNRLATARSAGQEPYVPSPADLQAARQGDCLILHGTPDNTLRVPPRRTSALLLV